MKKGTKREVSIDHIKQQIAIFACPICQKEMEINHVGTIRCSSNHTFDMAKQGYINFMNKPIATLYSKELFTARHEVIASGIYQPMQKEIVQMLKGTPLILDTGCGEGSHLANICDVLPNTTGVGIDIAKEGISRASKLYRQQIWCVADLASSPFQSASFSAILNILSPANYEEFKRLLRPDGKVIKVVPQANYLKELRAQVFADSDKEEYSNKQTVALFKEHFARVAIQRLTYTVPLAEELVPKLLQMTPISWHITENMKMVLPEITIDVDILMGEGV